MKRILLLSILVLVAACSRSQSQRDIQNPPPVPQKMEEAQPSKQIVFTHTDLFAFLDLDGSVVSWDQDTLHRIDVLMPTPLIGVKSIAANSRAIAAVKRDGTVVAWGSSDAGADVSALQSQLVNVVKIVGNRDAFAALKSDGSIVTWGSDLFDGDASTKYPRHLSGSPSKFKDVYVIGETFYGPRDDGTCLRLGFSDHDPKGDEVLNIKQVVESHDAKAILSEDGIVTNFGWFRIADKQVRNNQAFSNISTVAASSHAFAAIKQDGSVIAWGDPRATNFSPIESDLKSDVIELIGAGSTGFAARKRDGSVYVWGPMMDARKIIQSGAKKIYGNNGAFAILKDDGSVVAYGNAEYGGKAPDRSYGNITSLVIDIAVAGQSFAALRSSGEVVIWGHHYHTRRSLEPLKSDVISIEAYSTNTGGSLVARKRDGSVKVIGILGVQGEKYIK